MPRRCCVKCRTLRSHDLTLESQRTGPRDIRNNAGFWLHAARASILTSACFISAPLLASDIQGIGGFALGDGFDARVAAGVVRADDSSSSFVVEPDNPDRYVQMLQIATNPEKRISRISASSSPMAPKECQQAMNAVRKRTEDRFPSLGYYAMNNSDLFFEGDRSYTIECIKTDRGVVLRQDFWDDALEGQK